MKNNDESYEGYSEWIDSLSPSYPMPEDLMTREEKLSRISEIYKFMANESPSLVQRNVLKKELDMLMNQVCPVIKQSSNKHIEINGIANMLMLLEDKDNDDLFEIKMRDQLDLLERYMLAFADAYINDEPVPFWHEINANPMKYPTLKEKSNKGK